MLLADRLPSYAPKRVPTTVIPKLPTQKRVLVVDDDLDQHAIMRVLLGHHRYETVHATTLADARAVLAAEHIDLVVLDIRLGPEHGLDLLYSLAFEGPAVPILICTSDGFARQRYPGAARAAAGWMVKPVKFGELVDTLRTIIGADA